MVARKVVMVKEDNYAVQNVENPVLMLKHLFVSVCNYMIVGILWFVEVIFSFAFFESF